MEIITLFEEYLLHAPYIELFNMDQYLYKYNYFVQTTCTFGSNLPIFWIHA